MSRVFSATCLRRQMTDGWWLWLLTTSCKPSTSPSMPSKWILVSFLNNTTTSML